MSIHITYDPPPRGQRFGGSYQWNCPLCARVVSERVRPSGDQYADIQSDGRCLACRQRRADEARGAATGRETPGIGKSERRKRR